jgi:PAS domain S-box-containing protein
MPTVLVVDDNAAAVYANRRVLEQAGFRVREASTGSEALALAKAGLDLILLDIKLPDMSGLEVCRHLKGDPTTAAVPVLHLTATYGAGSEQAAALEAGADAYLTHPVEPIVLVATIRALLRAREAESKARQVTAWWQSTFDAIGDGVALLDSDLRVIRTNRALADLFGKTPQEMVGMIGVPAVPGMQEPKDKWPGQRALETRQRAVSELQAGDRWFEVVADPVLNEKDEVVAVVRWAKDITDRKAAEEKVATLLALEKAAREEAEQVNRLKDEFLATLSHELRTPLNAIVGWTQVLREGELEPEVTRRAMETIARNAQVQAQLISDILDVSRIVAGKLRLDMQEIDLIAAIRQAIETVRPAAEAKGIRMIATFDPDACPVTADGNRLQQVVLNVLSNAIKFSPRGGTVTVRLERFDSTVTLSIEDEGPGIDPAFLPHVFERFRQADASSTRRHGGLGLGLAIVRHLVELHGGTVEAANRKDRSGAIVRLTLNCLPAEAAALRVQPLTRAVTRLDDGAWLKRAPSLRGTSVLVVDDDEDARALLRFVLERCGATVFTAASSDEGVATLLERRPDALLADIEMPHEDGYTLITKVRALPPESGGETPAAALTAYASAQDRLRALEAGFQVHLVKPAHPAEVATAVASLSTSGPGAAGSHPVRTEKQ